MRLFPEIPKKWVLTVIKVDPRSAVLKVKDLK